ncbi:unnamed protein product [Mytilus edulis]|uniref:Uncharacterized protein n=1 Tax=Mytilus edulis TaxID=6550 RepID=A0A8S3UVA9_MYTED|nr:unnamed protein product [Mytilus edulis]
MNTTSTQSRSKRGLFNFIGSISRSLFGTATVKDVQKLARHVNILINRNNKFAKAMTEHDQLLSSFMSKTDERFQNIVLGVQQNHDIMVNLTSETSKFVAHFEEVSVKLSNLLIDQMNLSSSVNKYLEELKIGIHEMVKGNLSPFLISPNILKNTLKHVQLILNEKFKGFYLLNTDPAYYYSSSQLLYARNHSTLYVTLKFPISTFSSPLALYRVNSFPVPINSSSNHGTKIMDLPEYFVVTSNNQYYNHISYSRISSCTGKTTLYCSYSLPLVSTVSKTCISSLYFNSKQDVHEQCDFRFLMNVIKPTVEEIYDNTLLVYKMNTLAFECPNKHKIVKGCNFCFIQIPCMCSLSTDSLYIPKKIEKCTNYKDTVTILHPINLALIQHFFDSDTYSSILGDTTFTKQINIQIPSINIFNHSFSNIIAQDHNLHLSLKRIAQATLKQKTVFKSLSEPLINGDISMDDSWLDLNTILIISSLCVSGILVIACIVLFNKIRILTATLLLLQKIPRSQSLSIPSPLPSFIYKHLATTTESSHVQSIFNTQCNPWPFVALSFTMTLALVIVSIYFFKKFNNRNHTKVVLEITNGLSCITIPIVTLSLCPSDWDITAPNCIQNMRISGTFCTRLHADFDNFSIVNINTKHEVPIPEDISVNPYTASRLKKMFGTPFFCHVLITHHNYFTRIK